MQGSRKELVDSLYLIALQGINQFLPLLVLPYLMVVLGATGYGYIGFSLSVVQYSTQHPFCISIRISTLGQIVHFSFTIGIQKHNVFIIPTTDTYKFRKNPFTIGTPLKPLITITVRILILCIHHSTYLLSLEIDDADCRTIFKKCDFFSVRTILRIE